MTIGCTLIKFVYTSSSRWLYKLNCSIKPQDKIKMFENLYYIFVRKGERRYCQKFTFPPSPGVGKLFSEGATLLCPNFERAGMCVRLLMHHVFKTLID